jgi:antitoxin component of MazEF toxin-antitoxin module
MVKRLTKTGNSLALVIDRPMLDAVGIDADTPLDVSTNGDVIVISPVRGKNRQARFRSAVDAIHKEYAGVFRRLADS